MSDIVRVRGRLTYDRVLSLRRLYSDVKDSTGIAPHMLESLLARAGLRLDPVVISRLHAGLSEDNEDRTFSFEQYLHWFPTFLCLHSASKQERDAKAAIARDEPQQSRQWDRTVSAAMKALPYRRTEGDRTRRTALFARFDVNGNNYLSLAEVDKGIRDVLQMSDLFGAKPVLMRAFAVAKGAHVNRVTNAGRGPGQHYVELSEFRLLLEYLAKYYTLWTIFTENDADGDRRLTREECSTLVGAMSRWGVPQSSLTDAFDSMDTNRGGIVLFDEFANWALKRCLM